MSIWNKVLLGLIFVASLALLYFAARTLKTHQYWRELARRHQEEITRLAAEDRVLADGSTDGPTPVKGIRQLRSELHQLLIDRGRLWYHCTPGQINADTGQAAVTTENPNPHGIADKTILYVFEEADVAQKGQYLGEFKVSQVNPPSQLVLEPTRKLVKGSPELSRLAASKGPWSLYEVMPIDNHETSAGLGEAELKTLFAPEVLPEYLQDGRIIAKDEMDRLGLKGKLLAVDDSGQILYEDQKTGEPVNLVSQEGKVSFVDAKGQPVDAQGVVEKEVKEGKGRYVRQLRNYEALFRHFHLEEAVLADAINAAQQDKQDMEKAVAEAQRQLQFCQAEKAMAQADLAKYTAERNDASTLRSRLVAQVQAALQKIDEALAQNLATASQIAKIQLDVARQIDARTRRMAQTSTANN